MITEINSQIENINRAIAWVKKNRQDEYEQKFLQLVDERRKLRLIANVERHNPGIAAFGQSQVGKSYLMNCLMQDSDGAFMVDAPDGQHNYVYNINPIGEGQEATGVVTRFTSYCRNEAEYSPELPIRCRCISVRDLLLIISDAFYNDFFDTTIPSESEITERTEALKAKYTKAEDTPQAILTADDMLEMKEYFKRYINKARLFVDTSFFDQMALIIERIPHTDYTDVFSQLWDGNADFTKLFNRAMEILQRLKFAENLYLPIGAVDHNKVKEDTIMSVSCLKLLFDSNGAKYTTDAYIGTPGAMQKLGTFTKSELCTVCLEVVIRISERYLSKKIKYNTRDIMGENAGKMPETEKVAQVLKENDLLDFPGARARDGGSISKLSEGSGSLMYGFLRGKVAYLFNKYNSEKIINILLFCHHQKNLEAPRMWQLLNNWVNENIGNTPEKRARLIASTNVAPLFHIGTMWNINISPSTDISADTEKGVNARWKGRFNELLLQQCLRPEMASWVGNWEQKGQTFNNCYLLRDFTYSKEIYNGFLETRSEQSMKITRDYYELMRRTFVNSDDVKPLFKNPALAWDAASSIGNDGATYIINQLEIVARNIGKAREMQIKEQFADIVETCADCIADYYVTDDTAEILKANIRKANGIFREMEFTCQSQPEYFGHLLKSLQLTEAESYKRLHKLIPTLTRKVTGDDDIKDYELIRKRCGGFDDCNGEDAVWEKLISTYRFADREEAAEYLGKKGVDISKLVSSDHLQRRNSALITDDLMQLWKGNIQSVQFMNSNSGDSLVDKSTITNLTGCLIDTASSVGLGKSIEKEISDYVDVLNISNINEDFVADTIATRISDFICDFGFSQLDDQAKASARRIAGEQHLPCYDWITRERKESYTEDEITALFDDILSSSCRFTPAYDANYNKWLEYMYIAYIANIKVPEYDIEANNLLKEIIDDFRK